MSDETETLRIEIFNIRIAFQRLQGIMLEYAAKQAAQRMFLIGLGAHVGEKTGSFDVIVRGVEQATRDFRHDMRNTPGAGAQLIIDEMSRIAEELRGRMDS